MEAAERRQQSIAEGLETLKKLIAEGRRSEAEEALKLLRRLDLDQERLAELTKIIAQL